MRDFLATSRNGGVVPGQDADRFFLALCRELGVGAPGVIARPLDGFAQAIAALESTIVSDEDVQAEIMKAHVTLDRLRAVELTAPRADTIDDTISKIREARLAGDAAEAYRLANEALHR